MKRVTFSLVFVLLFGVLSAQQLPTFTRYHENLTFINPAALYIDYQFDKYSLYAGATYRYQWMGLGLKEAPVTQIVRFDNMLSDYDETFDWCLCNAGATLINDQTGPTGFLGLYGRFSYILDLTGRSGGTYLSIGASGGIVQYRANVLQLVGTDSWDPQLQESQTRYFPDVGGGIFFYNEFSSNQGFFVGASFPQSLGLNLTYKAPNGDIYIKRTQHFFGVAGGNFGLDLLKFRPTIFAKYVPNTPFNLDGNLVIQYKKQGWIGFGFSTARILHGEFGIIPINLVNGGNENDAEIKIGFSFSYPFQEYGPNFGPSGEINLTYMLDNSD